MSDLVWGGRVRTKDGQEGLLAKVYPNARETIDLRYPSRVGRGDRSVQAYAVILDSGEVRFYTEDALEAAD